MVFGSSYASRVVFVVLALAAVLLLGSGIASAERTLIYDSSANYTRNTETTDEIEGLVEAMFPGALAQRGCTDDETITADISNVIEGSFTALTPQTAVLVSIYDCSKGRMGWSGQLLIVEDGQIVLHDPGFGWLEGIVDTNGDGLSELISAYFGFGTGAEEFSASLSAYQEGKMRTIADLGRGSGNCSSSEYGIYDAFRTYYTPTNNGEYPTFEQEHRVGSCGAWSDEVVVAMVATAEALSEEPRLIFNLLDSINDDFFEFIRWNYYSGCESWFAQVNEHGETPLIHAITHGSPALGSLLNSGCVEVNVRTLSGWTPLMYAVRATDDEVVEALLEAGADPTAVAPDGASVARLAAANDQLSMEVKRRLGLRTASDGVTPCPDAKASPLSLFELARTYSAQEEGYALDILACADDLDVVDEYRQTPLYYAISANDVGAVRALLEFGADPNHRSNAGWTPLLMAARDSTDPRVVSELLDTGADPSAKPDDQQWRDALWYAQRNEHLIGTQAIVQLLLTGLYGESQTAQLIKSPTIVNRGEPPYLSQESPPSDVEVLLHKGTVVLTGRGEVQLLRGGPPDPERFAGRLDITFSVVELRLPLKLSARQHVAVITYVQDFDMTPTGDFDKFEDFALDPEDEVSVIIFDASGGAWGEVVVAIGTDRESGEQLQGLGFVPFGQLMLARTLSGDQAHLGQGAILTFEDTMVIEGAHVRIKDETKITSVTPQEVRLRTTESSIVESFDVSGYYGEVTTTVNQNASYDVVHRPGANSGALQIDGEILLAVHIILELDDLLVSSEVSIQGPMSITGSKVSWTGQTPETQRGVLGRIMRLLEKGL